ncbi:hypothetical protein SESBI_29922 [Sesbania bispinosa]|nr:hypothetical protein SESBI_29922 [Sesbania bispinosa]
MDLYSILERPHCSESWPTVNHSQGMIPDWQLDLPVASFAANGSWNWDLFAEFLSPQGLAALASINPPDIETGPDAPA